MNENNEITTISEEKDPYGVLGLRRDASPEEIKTRWRRLSLHTHPDRSKSSEALKEINEAYDVLKCPYKRRIYDEFGWKALQDHAYLVTVFRYQKKPQQVDRLIEQLKREQGNTMFYKQSKPQFSLTCGLDATTILDEGVVELPRSTTPNHASFRFSRRIDETLALKCQADMYASQFCTHPQIGLQLRKKIFSAGEDKPSGFFPNRVEATLFQSPDASMASWTTFHQLSSSTLVSANAQWKSAGMIDGQIGPKTADARLIIDHDVHPDSSLKTYGSLNMGSNGSYAMLGLRWTDEELGSTTVDAAEQERNDMFGDNSLFPNSESDEQQENAHDEELFRKEFERGSLVSEFKPQIRADQQIYYTPEMGVFRGDFSVATTRTDKLKVHAGITYDRNQKLFVKTGLTYVVNSDDSLFLDFTWNYNQITLNVGYSYIHQNIRLPILLSKNPRDLKQTLLCAGIAAATIAIGKGILSLFSIESPVFVQMIRGVSKEYKENRKEKIRRRRQDMRKCALDADRYAETVGETLFQKKPKRGDLVIIQAVYGDRECFPSLMVSQSTMPVAASSSSSAATGGAHRRRQYNAKALNRTYFYSEGAAHSGKRDVADRRYVDVTNQLQSLVEDNALFITEAPKSQAQGWYDPCPDLADQKTLRIHYEFDEKEYTCEIQDLDSAHLPDPDHLLLS